MQDYKNMEGCWENDRIEVGWEKGNTGPNAKDEKNNLLLKRINILSTDK